MLDEGDPFSEILLNKSINNMKSSNYFKNVNTTIINNDENKTKSIDISVEEKPTGEIYASAGFGTSGGSVGSKSNYNGCQSRCLCQRLSPNRLLL